MVEASFFVIKTMFYTEQWADGDILKLHIIKHNE